MGQVTIYLDDQVETKSRKAAKAAGISFSSWIANRIKEPNVEQWPADFAALLGSAPDFPMASELRKGSVLDARRVPLK